MLESGVTIDYAQLVMDAEFARMVKHCVPGIRVDDETLSVDVIADVGPFSDFLSHADTLKGMRSQSRSELIDRRVREDWEAAGSTTIYERAREKARRILEEHVPEPLPEDVRNTLRRIVDQADRDLVGATG
jgi:trimethylamine--corrinoid protein Co-methyltransferase